MGEKWKIFCEESGDKGIPWKEGSSHYYIISAILVREKDEQQLRDIIEKNKYKVLRMKAPLEWKKLKPGQKKDDKIISRFLRKVKEESPNFLVAQIICNKHETIGPGFYDRNVFMNYLYGLIFKRISSFLMRTESYASLTIDRNTDKIAQESLRNYLSDVSRYQTNSFPRFSKPKWINPEDHAVLGLADFVSGIALRSLNNYYEDVNPECKSCQRPFGIYNCNHSNFMYKRSFKNLIDWNYDDSMDNWDWKGLLYHPFERKNDYHHLFIPR
ncbi:MAG TPA: DUF3800 domain-containing protein [Sphingobacteriaceae bacterium]|nr:DUF3800 domain-containing protein [Sphingobacteriaceae bacterium]